MICVARQTDLSCQPAALGRAGRAHLIGAGGAACGRWPHVLRRDGWQLTGSDAAWAKRPGLDSPANRQRQHSTPTLDLVIHSDAVPADDR